MPRGVMFVLFAAVAGGAWSVLFNRASPQISPLLAPVIAESTAVLIGLALIATQLRGATMEYSTRGITLLLCAGVCVFFVDYFNIRAYGAQLPVSVGAPIFLGGAIAIATTAGFLLGEQINVKKLVGVGLVLAGVLLLGSMSE